MATKANRKTIDIIFTSLGAALAAVLLVAGCLGWYGYKFATNQVRTELAAQKIYFPPAGSAALPADEYPDLQKYGGQLVDDGFKAKAYANGYIGHHLKEVANGKTYAEISAEARKDPTNQTLQQQKQTLFQGETLRGILLGTGYSYWVFGTIAMYASLTAFVGAAVMFVLVLLGVRHIRRNG
jgi:hypothetical protein